MEEYRSNSHSLRDEKDNGIPEKRREPVVSGSATVQKKTGFSKFANSIIAEDMRSVGLWIVSDVIVPSVKKVIYDVITNGADMMLYGRASGPRSSSTISKVSYGSYYQKPYGSEPLRAGSNGGAFNYDNIVFDNRGDAEAVLTGLEDLLDQFEVVTVSDLYELADVASPSYTANQYGWTSLKGASVIRCRDGYLIKLPKVTVLGRK